MAYLNFKRDVNIPWNVEVEHSQATRDTKIWVSVPGFSVCIIMGMERFTENLRVIREVDCIALGEYLWEPNNRIRLTQAQAIATIEYLEATR